MKRCGQRRLAGLGSSQFGEDELKMLARAERVRAEVRTRTRVLARLRTADRHPVRRASSRIGDEKIREDRIVPEVLDLKWLIAAELPAQLGLPRFDRHAIRPTVA